MATKVNGKNGKPPASAAVNLIGGLVRFPLCSETLRLTGSVYLQLAAAPV